MGFPDITSDLFTSYEQLFYPFINLKDVNLIAANIPYDSLYHRTCFYSSWCQLPLNISCSSLKVESRIYQLQAMSKSSIIPWIFKAGSLLSFLLGQQALHTVSPLFKSSSQTKTLLNQFSVCSMHSSHRMVNIQ